MLVASQVLLSIILPTVILPLVFLCSKADIMSVDGPVGKTISLPAVPALPVPEEVVAVTEPARRSKTYRSPKWVTVLGYALFGLVVVANMYVIVELALGN